MIATRAAELPVTLDDRGESTTLTTSSCSTLAESGVVSGPRLTNTAHRSTAAATISATDAILSNNRSKPLELI